MAFNPLLLHPTPPPEIPHQDPDPAKSGAVTARTRRRQQPPSVLFHSAIGSTAPRLPGATAPSLSSSSSTTTTTTTKSRCRSRAGGGPAHHVNAHKALVVGDFSTSCPLQPPQSPSPSPRPLPRPMPRLYAPVAVARRPAGPTATAAAEALPQLRGHSPATMFEVAFQAVELWRSPTAPSCPCRTPSAAASIATTTSSFRPAFTSVGPSPNASTRLTPRPATFAREPFRRHSPRRRVVFPSTRAAGHPLRLRPQEPRALWAPDHGGWDSGRLRKRDEVRDAGREPIIPRTDRPFKTSIVFAHDREGTSLLFKVLSAFAFRDISLTKIESRPHRNRPIRLVDDANIGTAKHFEYMFYLDFEASMAEQRAQNALAEIQEFTSFLRVLGSYPMDMTPWNGSSSSSSSSSSPPPSSSSSSSSGD
ncbi:arogenate dehydratase 5, chloroplastic-like [Asparagus officinalis]|uniref:arogenate dehydratase 5, chloroplastic-like n=1 Tax=Asparagus officinalis TaxID=4686 RepID=UPI00098E2FEB|nr:arogenate dehydratase 5, chloroplastic-like [Asparagus officinalis]